MYTIMFYNEQNEWFSTVQIPINWGYFTEIKNEILANIERFGNITYKVLNPVNQDLTDIFKNEIESKG